MELSNQSVSSIGSLYLESQSNLQNYQITFDRQPHLITRLSQMCSDIVFAIGMIHV